MTIDELKEHIGAVVEYNWQDEYRDALENGLEGHVMNHLLALAAFVGDAATPEELAELKAAVQP